MARLERHSPPSRRPRRAWPCLERLEDRCVPTITSTPQTFALTEGIKNTATVATFTDSDNVGTGNFTSVTIDWGDKGTSAGTISQPLGAGTAFVVTGSHLYAEEGTFPVTVSFHDTNDNTDVKLSATAQVSDAPLSPGVPVSGGIPQTFNGVGGTNTSGGALTGLQNFEAAIGGPNNGGTPSPQPNGFRTINWDGVVLNGTDFGNTATVITPNRTVGIPLNRFQERGTFFEEVYAVGSDTGSGSFTDVNPSVTGLFPAFSPNNTFAMFNENTIDLSFVLPSPHTTTPAPAATRGFGAIFLNVEVANTTSIEYFNGDTSLGKFFAPVGSKGQAEFLGVLFNSPVVTRVELTLGTDVLFTFDGITAKAGTQADDPATGHNLVVTDDFAFAEPTALPNPTPTVHATAQSAFTGVVASFTDADALGSTHDYTAIINWGDGHQSNGTIANDPSGGFDVLGTNTYAVGGSYPVSVQIQDFGGSELTVRTTADVAGSVIAVGADAGAPPEVKVYDATTGALVSDFFAYDSHFLGGVRVAVADVNGDGLPDVITAPGPGGGPDVRVFDAASAGKFEEFMAYDPGFTGGVYVAAGDLNGDGKADVVTAPDVHGGPDVRVFNGGGATVVQTAEFFTYDPAFTGGIYVAAGDVNGDGTSDIITGAGAGGGPEVKAFNGATLGGGSPALLDDFYAYDPAFTGGVRVAAAPADGDGNADIITGAGPSGGPHVRVFDGTTGQQLPGAAASFYAFDPTFHNGIYVGGH